MDKILPWGSASDARLHWFGLTSGHYWVETPVGTALQYTEAMRLEWKQNSPYADYHVARLFEDLQNVLPAALEPVPSDIAALSSNAEWNAAIERHAALEPDTRHFTSDYFDAFEWRGERSIDSGHLVSGPDFYFCRVGDEVAVEWETPGENPAQTWVSPSGTFTISVDNFRTAAQHFVDGVLSTMQKRVDEIATNGWHRSDCGLDVPALIKEQRDRSIRAQNLMHTICGTDWNETRARIRELSTAAGLIDPLDYEGIVQ